MKILAMWIGVWILAAVGNARAVVVPSTTLESERTVQVSTVSVVPDSVVQKLQDDQRKLSKEVQALEKDMEALKQQSRETKHGSDLH